MIQRIFMVFLTSLLSFAAMSQPQKYRHYADETAATLQKWYNEETGLWETTSWWNAANALTALIDYSRITGSDEYLYVIDNTFEKCKEFEVEMPNPEDNWICRNFINDYYDDQGWWILAWIAAYDLRGEHRVLDMARVTFSDMAGGWDDVCGGGIYWKKPDIGKSAVQNELFMLCALRLHHRGGGSTRGYTYLEWATRTWDWFKSTSMINANYLVENGLDNNCRVNGLTYTYNQAMILSALAEMSGELEDPDLLELAGKIARSTIRHLVYENGILKEPHEPDLNGDATQFKGIFMRHLAFLNTVAPQKGYQDFILKNAESIWHEARNKSTGEIGTVWKGPFDQGDASRQSAALDAFNAAMMVNRQTNLPCQ